MIPLDSSIEYSHDDRGGAGLHVPCLGGIDIRVVRLIQVPAIGEVWVVHRGEDGVHAIQLGIANQRMGEGQREGAFKATRRGRGIDSHHMMIGEVGSAILRCDRRPGKLRANGLRRDQIEKGVCFG